jgi:hypothetical protein
MLKVRQTIVDSMSNETMRQEWDLMRL